MKGNPLIQIISTFTTKEMTRYVEFASSPYFNKHEDTIRLIQLLAKLFPDFSEKRCDRYKLFKKLYPQKAHHQANLSLLFTYAFRLLEKFLFVEQIGGVAFDKQIYLLEQYRARGFYQLYEKRLKKAQSTTTQIRQRDTDFYLQQFLMASEQNKYNGKLSKHEKDQSIQEKQDNLDHFYLSEKLKDACEVTLRRRILRSEYEIGMLDAAIVQVQSKPEKYAQNPSIQVYQSIYEMLTQREPSYYFKALETARQFEQQLPKGDWQNVYNYLQNYCIEQINAGHSDFLNQLFGIYKVQIEQELIFDGEYLLQWHYKNIITVGLRLKEFDWVYQFIEGYKGRIKEEKQSNAYTYNLAAYYYETQQLQDVLGLLLQVEYTDPRYYLGAKAILLKTYFDLAEFEALASLHDAFRQYLSRSKSISEARKEGYLNLFRLTKRLLQIKGNRAFQSERKYSEDLEKLEIEMNSGIAIFNKDWLIEKAHTQK